MRHGTFVRSRCTRTSSLVRCFRLSLMLGHSPGEPTMAQVMVRPPDALTVEATVLQWSYAEFAVVAGWFFFFLSLVQGLWTAIRWSLTPRRPGREGKAELQQGGGTEDRTCSPRGKTSTSGTPRRSWSPERESSRARQVSVTPERRRQKDWMRESPGRSPEVRLAQTRILEAMVQRAQPVVQDLQDMQRLGGGGPGPMLRRGSRIH